MDSYNEIDSEICYIQADEFRRTFCIMGSWEKYLANLSYKRRCSENEF